MYSEEYFKTEIKSYDCKVNKNFYENKRPKEGVYCVFLSIILIDSVFKMDNCYYPQMFSEKCKYVAKEKKTSDFIDEDIELSSDESD